MRVPENYRVTSKDKGFEHLASDSSYGNNGAFKIVRDSKIYFIIASDEGGWEHVSVSIFNNKRCPYWDEMCFIKDLFWNEDEAVVQYHPSKKEYVNQHEHVLHLWRPLKSDIPTPPMFMV